MDGFDLYKYPHTVPFNTIEVPRKAPFVHGASFVKNGTQIACGSDHRIIYLHSMEQGEISQKLKHGSQKIMIQALDVSIMCSTLSRLIKFHFKGNFHQ